MVTFHFILSQSARLKQLIGIKDDFMFLSLNDIWNWEKTDRRSNNFLSNFWKCVNQFKFHFIVETVMIYDFSISHNCPERRKAVTKEALSLNKILFIVICQPNNQHKDYQNGRLDRLIQCLFVFFYFIESSIPPIPVLLQSPGQPDSYLHLYFDLYQSIRPAELSHPRRVSQEWCAG